MDATSLVHILLLLAAVVFASLAMLSAPERPYRWLGASLACFFLHTLLVVFKH